MQPEALLKLATEQPSQFGLEAYLDTICELRRKGYTWRSIADFLIEKGVKTDHARVYRLMMEGDPLFDFHDYPLNIGGLLYESQKGQPLRPYNSGLFITIEAKLNCFALEHPEKVISVWCQCQFRLSATPNFVWFKQLHTELRAEFNPHCPSHLISFKRFQLKFAGDVMALDCPTYNLSQQFAEVRKAVENTTRYFLEDKSKWTDQRMRDEERNKKILELYSPTSEGDDEVLEGHAEEYDRVSERLKKEFEGLSLRE